MATTPCGRRDDFGLTRATNRVARSLDILPTGVCRCAHRSTDLRGVLCWWSARCKTRDRALECCVGEGLRHRSLANRAEDDLRQSLTVAVRGGPQRHRLPPTYNATAGGRQLQCGVRWRQAPRHGDAAPLPGRSAQQRRSPPTRLGSETLRPPPQTPGRGDNVPPAPAARATEPLINLSFCLRGRLRPA